MSIHAGPPDPGPNPGTAPQSAIGPYAPGDDWLWPIAEQDDPDWVRLARRARPARDGQRPPEFRSGHAAPTIPVQVPQVPATQLPATQLPATQLPATQLPATQVPATQLPATAAQANWRPAETGPAQSQPAQSRPAQSRPAQSRPAQSGPAQSGHAETRPAETRPAETGLVATADGDEAWAMAAYFSSVCLTFLAPLIIYLIRQNRSPFSRAHAAQATNLAISTLLYTLSILIVGGMLAMDTLMAGLITACVAATVLWVVALYHVARAVIAASAGTFAAVPGWLAAPVVKAGA